MWRWLVNGLAGLAGMMLACEKDGPGIEKEHHDKLCETIRILQELRDRLKARDQQ